MGFDLFRTSPPAEQPPAEQPHADQPHADQPHADHCRFRSLCGPPARLDEAVRDNLSRKISKMHASRVPPRREIHQAITDPVLTCLLPQTIQFLSQSLEYTAAR
jgi:hypothetical protein